MPNLKMQLVDYSTAILAREKGFNEECTHAVEWYELHEQAYGPFYFGNSVSEAQSIPPKERSIMDDVAYLRLSSKMRPIDHYSNQSLPPWIHALPTQDLLESWLREVKNIHIYIRLTHGITDRDIPPLYYATVWTSIYNCTSGWWGEDKGFARHHMARESALIHALNLLP